MQKLRRKIQKIKIHKKFDSGEQPEQHYFNQANGKISTPGTPLGISLQQIHLLRKSLDFPVVFIPLRPQL
jgi:hypothetical protein